MSFTKSKDPLAYAVFFKFAHPSEIDFKLLSRQTGLNVAKLSGMLSRLLTYPNLFIELVYNHGFDPEAIPAWVKRPKKSKKKKAPKPKPIPIKAPAYIILPSVHSIEPNIIEHHNPYPLTRLSHAPSYGGNEAKIYPADQDRIWRKVLKKYFEENRRPTVDEIQTIMDKAVFECTIWDSYQAQEAAAILVEREKTMMLLYMFLCAREAQNQPEVYTEQDLRRVQQDFEQICNQIRNYVQPSSTFDQVMDVVKSMTETLNASRIKKVDMINVVRAIKKTQADIEKENFDAVLSLGKMFMDNNKRERERRHKQMIMMTGGVDYTSKGLSLYEIEKMFKPSHKPRRSRF